MKTRVIVGVLWVALGCVCSGCGQSGWRRPSPLPEANARLNNDGPFHFPGTVPTAADVVLTGQFLSREEFSQQRRGNWIRHWYQVRFTVLTVEKGTWAQPDISFICTGTWPSPESGITLDSDPFPYRPGVQMRFWLDSRKTPADILGHQDLAGKQIAVPRHVP